MTTVAIVSPGFMGAGLGGALLAGGARVVATVRGRSERTSRLAAEAGLELLPGLDQVVAAADVVLSVTPPGDALAVAAQIRAAAVRTGTDPLVADLNAVSPTTIDKIAAVFPGQRFVDGSISGPPPSAQPGARLYLSGPEAATIAALPWAGRIDAVVLGERAGSASALKMCTASVYKGLTALVTQAMRTAGAYGVLEGVVDDLERNGLEQTAGVARSATKARRFVDEMLEISAAQAGAGLTPDLFAAMAVVYRDVAASPLAQGDPERDRDLTPAEVVRLLAY